MNLKNKNYIYSQCYEDLVWNKKLIDFEYWVRNYKSRNSNFEIHKILFIQQEDKISLFFLYLHRYYLIICTIFMMDYFLINNIPFPYNHLHLECFYQYIFMSNDVFQSYLMTHHMKNTLFRYCLNNTLEHNILLKKLLNFTRI